MSAGTRETSPLPGAGTCAKAGTLFRIYWLEDRNSLLFALFDTAVLPGCLMYLGACTLHGEAAVIDWLAGCLAFGTGLAAMTSSGTLILHDRLRGRLALLAGAGVGRGAYMLAHVGGSAILGFLSLGGGLAVLALCDMKVSGMAPTALGLPLAPITAAIVAGIAMGGIGAAIGASAKDMPAGQATLSMVSIGLALVSPVFYSADRLPQVVQALAELSPYTALARIDRAFIAGTPVPVFSMALLLALAVAANRIAARALRWA